MALKTHMKFSMAEPDFLQRFFFAPNIVKIDQKWAKDGFLNLLKNLALIFTEFVLK